MALPTKGEVLKVLTADGILPKHLVSAHLYSLYRSNVESSGDHQASIQTATYMALIVFRDATPENAQRYALAIGFTLNDKATKEWNKKIKKQTLETSQFTHFSGTITAALKAYDTNQLDK